MRNYLEEVGATIKFERLHAKSLLVVAKFDGCEFAVSCKEDTSVLEVVSQLEKLVDAHIQANELEDE